MLDKWKKTKEFLNDIRKIDEDFSISAPVQHRRKVHLVSSAAAFIAIVGGVSRGLEWWKSEFTVVLYVLVSATFAMWYFFAYLRSFELHYNARMIFPVSSLCFLALDISAFGLSETVFFEIWPSQVIYCWALTTISYRNILNGNEFKEGQVDSNFGDRTFVLFIGAFVFLLIFEILAESHDEVIRLLFVDFGAVVCSVQSEYFSIFNIPVDDAHEFIDKCGDTRNGIFFDLLITVSIISITWFGIWKLYKKNKEKLADTQDRNFRPRILIHYFCVPLIRAYIVALPLSVASVLIVEKHNFSYVFAPLLVLSLLLHDLSNRGTVNNILATPEA